MTKAQFTLFLLAIIAVPAGFIAPDFAGQVEDAPFTAGAAKAHYIQEAMDSFAKGHGGTFPLLTDVLGDNLQAIGVTAGELKDGAWKAQDFSVTSTAKAYTVTAKAPFTDNAVLTVDEKGHEGGNYWDATRRYFWWRDKARFAIPIWGLAVLLAIGGVLAGILEERKTPVAEIKRRLTAPPAEAVAKKGR